MPADEIALSAQMQQLLQQQGNQQQLAMQNYMAQMQGYWNAASAPSDANVQAAQNYLQPLQQQYQQQMNRQFYTQDEMNRLGGNAYSQVNNQAAAMQGAINNQLAQRGLQANPLAAAGIGMAGQFAAGAARGNAMAGLAAQNAQGNQQNQLSGLQGMANIGSQQAQWAGIPTAEQMRAGVQQSMGNNQMPQFDWTSNNGMFGGRGGGGGGNNQNWQNRQIPQGWGNGQRGQMPQGYGGY